MFPVPGSVFVFRVPVPGAMFMGSQFHVRVTVREPAPKARTPNFGTQAPELEL